jgi:hypothetical protein
VYSVRRQETSFSLLVTNTGDGLEYHPRKADPVLDGAFIFIFVRMGNVTD